MVIGIVVIFFFIPSRHQLITTIETWLRRIVNEKTKCCCATHVTIDAGSSNLNLNYFVKLCFTILFGFLHGFIKWIVANFEHSPRWELIIIVDLRMAENTVSN